MGFIDWVLVVVLNGSIILYALFKGRDTKTSSEWFLAGRSLPWWMVGLSLYATAIDSSDLIADSGGIYKLGMSFFLTNWVGVVSGWILAANFIALPMYRAGMFTNAEYLEARFSPATRVVSALVQVLYRTAVMGIIATTLFLTLRIVCHWGEAACWTAVVLIAMLATLYTVVGGLRSVAITDALQSIVMAAAAMLLFWIVWSVVGGYSGMEKKMAQHEPGLPARMLHIGHDRIEEIDVSDRTPEQIARRLLLGGEHDRERGQITRRTPMPLVALSFIIMGMAYSIVNHTQSMRLFGSRSEWDMRMSVVLAGTVMLFATFFNLSMGLMARAIWPTLADLPVDESLKINADAIYPLLVEQYTATGLKGVIVAGIFAAAFSTYDSIGSTLSALLTRDVYSRFLVPGRDDHHYLRVGQWLTAVVIFGSFLYVPFLRSSQGMLLFFIELVGTFVVPLLTLYLMGTFTRVHRSSGTLGLIVGTAYGMIRLLTPMFANRFGIAVLPPLLANSFVALPAVMFLTATTMLIVSLVRGFEPRGQLLHEEAAGWLRASQLQLRDDDQKRRPTRGAAVPLALGAAVMAAGIVLGFVVFW